MFDTISLLRNPIQHYVWGSKTAIPKLLNIPNPERNPMAELWMGAHPKAPSQVCVDGRWVSLIDVIASSPESVLGSEVARRFDSQLPFLFKILAAAEPLSIQVHPNKQQAIEGFAMENELGIPLDAPYRNYRDDNHKPELLCALTPFEALKGFRSIDDILDLMKRIDVLELSPLVDGLRDRPNVNGLERFFRMLMKMEKGVQARMVSRVVERAKEKARERRELYWVMELGKKYPGDVGVLSPLFLNLIYLEPGQAMFLPAGELHAYLGGTGLEIMANSDNVLRGGLTAKHVDVDELLKIVRFEPGRPEILHAQMVSEVEKVYRAPAEEFELSYIFLEEEKTYYSAKEQRIEILLCLEGEVRITRLQPQEETLQLEKGDSVIIPACAHPYHIKGKGIIYKATVPFTPPPTPS